MGHPHLSLLSHQIREEGLNGHQVLKYHPFFVLRNSTHSPNLIEVLTAR